MQDAPLELRLDVQLWARKAKQEIIKARAEGFAAGRAGVVQVIRMWRDMDRDREREMRAKGGISNKESAYEAELRADFLDELMDAVGAAEKEVK